MSALDGRRFLRTVVVLAAITNVCAALVVRAEQAARPFAVWVVAEKYRLQLTDDIVQYGEFGAELNARVRQETVP